MKNFYLALLLVIIAFLFGLVCAEVVGAGSEVMKLESVEVKVCEGDTLWTIANTYTDNTVDVRRAIYEIQEYNELDTAEIHPGEIIIIPGEVRSAR